MADESTSVGTIQLDVEINQSSLNAELNKLGSVFNNSFKNMFSGIVSQTNSFVKDSVSRIANSFKNFAQSGTGSSEKVSQSINKMNAEYEKTETKIAEIRKELAKLYVEQDEIAKGYQDLPSFSGMSKDESIGQMLEADPRYNELSAQIDNLISKMDPLIEKNQSLANEINSTGDKAEDASPKIQNLGNKSDKAGKNMDRASIKTKLFGDEMKKSGSKATGFAAMINRSFMTVIRRLFVYSLILKGIRGVMSYIGAALKTNQQFVNSLNIIRTNLRVAFQPIYEFILPALNALMQAVGTITTYIASAINALFGKTYQQSFNAAKSMNKAIETMSTSTKGAGKSAKKAGKDAQSTLMSFDEINQLDLKDKDDSSGGAGDFKMTMPDTSTIDLSGIEKFKEALQPTIEALGRLKDALEPLKTFAVQGLKDFYNEFLVPVGKWTLGEGLPRFIDALANGLMAINWQPINDGLKNLWQALAPFAINVGEGLLWFWENVLVPLGTWTMNEIVPIFLKILAEAIRILNGVIDALKPLGQWLWENFLLPIAQWTGGIIVKVLDGIAKGLGAIGDWIENHQQAVENMAIAVASFMTAWLIVDLAVKIGGIVSALIEFITTGGLATMAMQGFAAVMAFITSPITIAVAVIGTLITVGVLLYRNWDEVSAKVKEIWESIKTKAEEIWNAIADFFVGLWEGITTVLTEAWNAIVEFLVGLWNGLSESVTEIWTAIKEFFSTIWDAIKTKVEEVWNAIKTFLVDTIWNPIKTSAQTLWNSIKDNILKPINEAWTKLKEVWAQIKKYVLDKWDEIKQGIIDRKDNLIKAIKEPFETAKDWIGDLIKDAFNWGKNLIGNIIDGIKSMVGEVKDAVSNVADAIADRLGIHSPSKKGPLNDSDKWMPNLMQMLADGIQDNIYEVSASVNMTAENIKQGAQTNADDMASAVGSAVLQSMKMAGNNQNQGDTTIEFKIDGATFARVVVPYIDNEKNRIGSVVIQPI